MIASFLIALREGVEAALIVGVILSFLKKIGAAQLAKPVYYGTGAGILGSIGVGALFLLLSVEFKGTGEQIFEGATMFLAAAILTTVIFWMRSNSKAMSEDLRLKVEGALKSKRTLGLAVLAFVSIFREGIETVLFLGSASFTASGIQTIVGGSLGLLAAVLLGIGIVKYSVRLDLKTFFNVTGFFLILFAAGLVARSLGEFNEARIVPEFVGHVWNTNNIISDQSSFGAVLTTLFGYTAAPSLAQVLGYVGYWILVLLWIYRDATFGAFRKAYAKFRPA